MSSPGKVPYQRLQHEGGFDEDETALLRSNGSSKFKFKLRRVGARKRLRVPSLRRFMVRRLRLVSAVRLSCGKVVKRLKESKAHFGDLFAGNYMFLQVGPTPFRSCPDKSFSLPRYSVPELCLCNEI